MYVKNEGYNCDRLVQFHAAGAGEKRDVSPWSSKGSSVYVEEHLSDWSGPSTDTPYCFMAYMMV